MLCVRSESDGESPRQHPKHAHTTHQVAMLKSARMLCYKIVSMQAACYAASDQGAVYCTHHGTPKNAQLHEAVKQFDKAEGKVGRCRSRAGARGVRIATD